MGLDIYVKARKFDAEEYVNAYGFLSGKIENNVKVHILVEEKYSDKGQLFFNDNDIDKKIKQVVKERKGTLDEFIWKKEILELKKIRRGIIKKNSFQCHVVKDFSEKEIYKIVKKETPTDSHFMVLEGRNFGISLIRALEKNLGNEYEKAVYIFPVAVLINKTRYMIDKAPINGIYSGSLCNRIYSMKLFSMEAENFSLLRLYELLELNKNGTEYCREVLIFDGLIQYEKIGDWRNYYQKAFKSIGKIESKTLKEAMLMHLVMEMFTYFKIASSHIDFNEISTIIHFAKVDETAAKKAILKGIIYMTEDIEKEFDRDIFNDEQFYKYIEKDLNTLMKKRLMEKISKKASRF